MYKIGDFSRLCQVSVKTLHHYDDVGLVRPIWVDQENGYRYYSAEQVAKVRRILNLKTLGLSLDEISTVLDGSYSLEQVQNMILEKQNVLQQLLHDTQNRLDKIDIWLKQILEEEQMPRLDVIVKKVEPMLVASMREKTVSGNRMGEMFGELGNYVENQGGKYCGPAMSINHDIEYQESCSDTEIVCPIAAPIPGTDQITIYEIPGVEEMACLIYQGAHDAECDAAHEALAKWIEENGYRVNGPDRLVFLHCDDQDKDGKAIVEFQYPVERINE